MIAEYVGSEKFYCTMIAKSQKIYKIELDSEKYTTDIEFGKGSRNFCKESFAGLLLSFACIKVIYTKYSKH